MTTIRQYIDAVRSRQQRQWMWQTLSWGLVAGGILGIAGGLVRLGTASAVPWSWIAAAVVGGPAMGLLISIVRPRAIREAAVAIDRSCGLKDRVTTALGFLSRPPEDSPWRQLQLDDTEAHLAAVDPIRVAPIKPPRPWFWGVAVTIAAVVIGIVSNPRDRANAAVAPNEVVVAQAAHVEEAIQELEEFNAAQSDPEIEMLLKELAEKLDELKRPETNPKEALAKLSEMETALQQRQEQLADLDAEAQLQSIGQALALSEQMQAAGQAMAGGEMERAAGELAKLDLPKLAPQTERAVTEKLDQLRQNTADGLRKRLRESVGKVSEGICQGDRRSFKEGMAGLAGECKKQGRRNQLADLLRKQCRSLSECKGACESACRNLALAAKRGGKNWGLAAGGAPPGEAAPQLNGGPKVQVTGTESESGETNVETLKGSAHEQDAVRQYRAKVEKYEQLSESVLESEPIPLGHRQTIRRYFEMIRPQNGEMDAVIEQTSSEK